MVVAALVAATTTACREGDAPPNSPAGQGGGGGDATTVDVRIVAFNDLHGRLEPDPDGSRGGVTYLATHIEMLRAEQPNTIVVEAGDLIGASQFFSGILHDEPTIAAMSTIGIDVAGVGNHEFDRPFEELTRLINGGCHEDGCVAGGRWAGASFPLLGANVLDGPGGTPLLDTSLVIDVAGAKIGFIGLTLESTASIVYPPFVEELYFAPEVQTVNALVPMLRAQGAETIVVVMHHGAPDAGLPNACPATDNSTFDIVEAFDDAVDVVVTGHSHAAYVCDNGKLVTQAGEYGELLTVIDLTVDVPSQQLVSMAAHNRDVTRDVGSNSDIDQLFALYEPIVAAERDRVIGSITETIVNDTDSAGQRPTGFLVADAFLAATAGDGVVAFTNQGGLRTSLDYPMSGNEMAAGEVTYGELYDMTPFGNQVVTMTLTGAQIEALLEQQFTGGAANTLQPSAGFSYSWAPNGASGNKVDPLDVWVDGAALDLGASYRVTVNSFIAEGSGGFPLLEMGTEVTYGALDRDVIEAYMTANSPLSSPQLDRIMVK